MNDYTKETLIQEDDIIFFNAFKYAAIGMALVAPDGKWLKVNRSLCEMLGYLEEEILDKTFQDITHPDDLDEDLVYVTRMLAGVIDTYQMEKRYFHKEGYIINILLSVSLVVNKDGSPRFFISQIQDITLYRSTVFWTRFVVNHAASVMASFWMARTAAGVL